MLALSFSSVVVAEELELEGWLLVLGELPVVAPAPAEPLVVPEVELLLLGLVDAPPPALFFSSVLIEPDTAPEGEDGVVEGDVVAPDEDAAPEGGVAVSRAVRPVSLSPQAARPKATETAAARIGSFMCSPPWLG